MLHNSRKIAAVDGVVFASALLVNVASALLLPSLAADVLSSPSVCAASSCAPQATDWNERHL